MKGGAQSPIAGQGDGVRTSGRGGRSIMPTAAKHQTWDQAGSERELDRLMAEGRQFSAEYPQFLANHLPMVLVALQRLGAGDDRLREFFATYRDTNHLIPMPKAVAPIERARWSSALGEPSRERDYPDFSKVE